MSSISQKQSLLSTSLIHILKPYYNSVLYLDAKCKYSVISDIYAVAYQPIIALYSGHVIFFFTRVASLSLSTNHHTALGSREIPANHREEDNGLPAMDEPYGAKTKKLPENKITHFHNLLPNIYKTIYKTI